MFKLFKWLGGLIILLIIAAVALPFIVPVESYRDDILKLVEKKTGREVAINGEINLSVYPALAVTVNDVSIKNPKGSFVSPHFAKIDQLNLQVALQPLFSKQLDVEGLSVSGADIYLEEMVGKKNNWQFQLEQSGEKNQTDTASESTETKKKMALNIKNIAIDNSQIHYIKPGLKVSTKDLQLSYNPDEASFSTGVIYGGDIYNIAANTSAPNSLMSDENVPLSLSLKSTLANADFSGTISNLNINGDIANPTIGGTLKASTAMLASSLGQTSLNSRKFSATKDTVKLGLMTLNTNKIQNITGETTIKLSGKKPKINATLAIPKLDINALTNSSKKASLSLFIASAHAQSNWSNAPISMPNLSAVNADATLAIGKLIAPNFVASNVDSQLSINNGALNVKRFIGDYLGGKLNASGAASPMKSGLNWNGKVKLSNVPFQKISEPFVKGVAISGTTNANLSLRASGRSLRDFIGTLRGGGDLNITDGVVSGYSLPKLFTMVRKPANEGDVSSNANEKTPFSRIHASISIDKGIANLREGELKSSRLKADAKGTISLPTETLNLRLTPEIIPKATGSDAVTGGLKVPLTIKGSFNNPKIRPDFSAAISNILKNPKDIKKTLKNFKAEGKSIEDSLEPTKENLKKNWKDLKDNKNPAAVGNILKEIKGFGF